MRGTLGRALACASVCVGAIAAPGQDPVPAQPPASTSPAEPFLRAGEPMLRIGGVDIGGDEYGRWLLSTHGPRRAREFVIK